jgi:hypothetical protein
MFFATMRLAVVAVVAIAQMAAAQSAVTGLLRPGDRIRLDTLREGRLVSTTPDSLVVSLAGTPRHMAIDQVHSLDLAFEHRQMARGALMGTMFAPGPGTLIGLAIGSAWKSETWVGVSPARIRLESMEWQDKVGTLTSLSTDAIGLRIGGTDLSIPKHSVQTFAISRGRYRRTGFGASIGAPAGVAIGLLAMSQSKGDIADLGTAVAAIIVGGGAGAIVGGAIGHNYWSERWTELPSKRWR